VHWKIKFKIQVVYKSTEKNEKKIKEKPEFLRKIGFGFGVGNSKTND